MEARALARLRSASVRFDVRGTLGDPPKDVTVTYSTAEHPPTDEYGFSCWGVWWGSSWGRLPGIFVPWEGRSTLLRSDWGRPVLLVDRTYRWNHRHAAGVPDLPAIPDGLRPVAVLVHPYGFIPWSKTDTSVRGLGRTLRFRIEIVCLPELDAWRVAGADTAFRYTAEPTEPADSRHWYVPAGGSHAAVNRRMFGAGSQEAGTGAAQDADGHHLEGFGYEADAEPTAGRAARDVGGMLEAGHGITVERIPVPPTGEGSGGRVQGAAAYPADLPRVFETLPVWGRDGRQLPESGLSLPCGVISEREMRDAIRRAELTEAQRAALLPRVFAGPVTDVPTQDALAKRLGIAQPAVARREKRAAEKVRAVLEADGFAGFARHLDPGASLLPPPPWPDSVTADFSM